MACKPITFEMHQNTPGVQCVKDGEQNWTPVVRRRERGRSVHSMERTGSGPKNDSSNELDIGVARQVYTIKSMAKFLASMFTGVAPDLVCRGFPLQPAQYPLEPQS